jgi:hypothetical protein
MIANKGVVMRKLDVVFVACFLVCLLCMPLLVIGGLIVLSCYALLSELADGFLGGEPDMSDAREVAQRLCYRNDG